MQIMFPRLVSIAFAIACFIVSLRGAPVEVAPIEMRGAVQPQVAVAPGGEVHIVFGKGNAIYHTTSTDGRHFSKPTKLGELDKLALGMRRGPRVAATDKVVVVAAISHSDGNIHVWTSSNGGATWKEGPKVNDWEKSAREGLQSIADDGRGFVFAAWLDDRNGGKQVWGASSRDGGETWSTNQLIYASPAGHVCECCHPSVAVDGTGRVAVMWRNWLSGSRDFYLAMSDDRGKTFSGARKLGEGNWKLNACPMDGGSVAIESRSEPIAIWRREKGIFSTDSAVAERPLAKSGTQGIVLPTANGASFVWETEGRLMLMREGGTAAIFAEHGRMVAGAVRPGGGAILVWETSIEGAPTIVSDLLP